MSPRLPDFIIAGAARSATTWLYHAADRHPHIAMAKPFKPEPKFFLRDDLYARGLAYYSATWFASLPEDRVIGEKSTNYMESREAAFRIAKDLPNVKLVFMLRHPVDRAYSNYLWTKQNGLELETFERALELEEQRERDLKPEWRYARPFSYFSRGLYADILEPWLARFKREQLLFLKSEDVAQRPGAVATQLHEFLGLPPCPNAVDELGVINAAERDAADGMAPATREKLTRRYRDSLERLTRVLGIQFNYS